MTITLDTPAAVLLPSIVVGTIDKGAFEVHEVLDQVERGEGDN